MLHDHVSDSLSSTLGNKDNTDVWSSEELTKLSINLLVSGISFDDHEVLLSTLVSLAHAGQKKTSDCGGITDSGD